MRLTKIVGALALCLLAAQPIHAQQQDIRAFIYGNSLINHVSGSDETTMPFWLSILAQAGGHGFAADGAFGAPLQFADQLPPEPNWSFQNVTSIWDSERFAFRRANFNTIILNNANFIQANPPDAPYEWGNPQGYSPLSATLRVFDWTEFQARGARFFIYEGWSDLALISNRFPPRARALARYHDYNRGDYHDWYVEYVDMIREARPELDVTLIPVASILAELFSEGSLADLEATDLYLDDAPHGTPTLYFLAALVTYTAIFNEEPPATVDLPDSIHADVREGYADIAGFIWARIQGSAFEDHASLTPETGLTDPALAMGLTGLSEWSTQMPFINLMRSARPWIGHLEGQWGGIDASELELSNYLTPEGWPLGLPEGVVALESFILSDLPPEAVGAAGRYRVTWTGRGTFRLGGRVENVDMGDHEAWFDFTPGEGPVALRIEATDAADPIRDIVVLRAEHIPLYELGEMFNPDWISRIRDLRSVRFMDWMDTNASPQVIWTDRPRMSDYTWVRRGVPVEVMVRLANQIGADPWFTLPHMADDRYVRAFASYVEERLAPDLRVYAEWSNEVWNFLFAQAHWAADMAAIRWDGADGDAWMQYAGLRAAQVADIWAEVFEGQEDRLIRVIATQTSWPGLEVPLLEAPLAQAEGHPAPYESFDAYAVAGYFGTELGSDERVGEVLSWIDRDDRFDLAARVLRRGSLGELIDTWLPYHADVAADHCLSMVMYEGGTHVVGLGDNVWNEDLTRFLIDFNYSPQMSEIYSELLAGWRDSGGTLFNAAVDVSAASQWGSWGALRHLDDTTARWATLMAYNATAGGWETRATDTFAHGVYRWGSAGRDDLTGTAQRDIFVAGDGNDRLFLGPGDRAHGGGGQDLAVLPGQSADYALVEEDGRMILNGPDGPIWLVSVEVAEFESEPGVLYGLESD
ncbi:calcium-binding protein [Nioella aestuarii]|uniref:calcium-binding protein n=1 Tax=Nioella aestuarii TaxID=1662864 RepID=UPI003D7F9219